jgi:D-arabinose 1-dehydrogenase-like Zn-dependent alcohol dehydrogenase
MCSSDRGYYRAASGEAFAAFGLRSPQELGLDPEAGTIAGHEPCGPVVEVGALVDPGQVYVGSRDGAPLRRLWFRGECRAGWTQMCEHGATAFGATAHGAHADFMKVPSQTLPPLPDRLSCRAGLAISCGTGTAYASLVRGEVTTRDSLRYSGWGRSGSPRRNPPQRWARA